jgi:hypothetical protein
MVPYKASLNQGLDGAEHVPTMQVSGKELSWTSAPLKTADGKGAFAKQTFERLE